MSDEWRRSGIRYPNVIHRISPKRRVNKIDLVTRMIDLLIADASLILQGDVSRCSDDISRVPGALWVEMPRDLTPLTLVGGSPEDGWVWEPVRPYARVILPLEPQTRDIIVHRILPRIGIVQHIQHVIIAKDGVVQFLAEDHFLFREGFVWTGPAVSPEMLASLVEQGVIGGYERG